MARIVIPSTWTVQLAAYGQRLQREAEAAATKAGRFLQERVQEKARSSPEWAGLADNIEVWSQDGQLVIGFQDEQFRSQAFGIEYGDEVRPPTPLFRTLTADVREADDVYIEHMRSVYGYGRLTET
jgi:hypothetical protein